MSCGAAQWERDDDPERGSGSVTATLPCRAGKLQRSITFAATLLYRTVTLHFGRCGLCPIPDCGLGCGLRGLFQLHGNRPFSWAVTAGRRSGGPGARRLERVQTEPVALPNISQANGQREPPPPRVAKPLPESADPPKIAAGGRTSKLNGKEIPSRKSADSEILRKYGPGREIGGLCLQDFLGRK